MNRSTSNKTPGKTPSAWARRAAVFALLIAATFGLTLSVLAAPAPPTTLTATAGNAQVTLNWTAPTTGGAPTSYNIYRSTTSGGEGATPVVTGVTSTTYTDIGLTNGTTYFYVVTAVNTGGESANSNEASARPFAVTPLNPAQGPLPSSPNVPTPYSSPLFHAGGILTPDAFSLPFENPLYSELLGTPTAVVDTPNGPVATEVPSFLLGNYDPTLPPAGIASTGVGTFFPNHFRDGSAFSWSAPLTFIAGAGSTGSTTAQTPDVQGTPVAVNATEYPEISSAKYFGILVNTQSSPDTTPRGGGLTTGDHAIRQVVYFGRSEYIVDTLAGSSTLGRVIHVGAIYCVDGFTGEVIWRRQTPYRLDSNGNPIDGSVFSTPAVARINVITGTNPTTYANKLVVLVGDNNGFVYCLDAVGNGDGTSNINAVDTTNNQPIYDPSKTNHLGTTTTYWVWRPDAAKPQTPGVTQAQLPVPTAFNTASPTVYVERGIPTAPAGTTLTSNAVVYIGNSNGVLYALDALGVPNTTPASNASLVLTGPNGIGLNVPTCNPRWWFIPVGQPGVATIESAPALSPPLSRPSITIVTADQNPATGVVTFTATVSDGSGNGGTPTGTVTFTINGTAGTPVPLTNGVATTTFAALTAGPNTVTAAYSGDANFSPGASPGFIEYAPTNNLLGATITVITSSANPSAPGQPVTFTATVTDDSLPARPQPTGTVQFSVDGTAVAGGPVALVGGAATYTTTTLTSGAHTITAVYRGDAAHLNNNPSGSLGQVVLTPVGPTVYIGTSNEMGIGSNMGRVYALNGFSGPTDVTGKLALGAAGYNVNQRPLWSFPNAYAGGAGSTGSTIRPALGDISGSPDVFSNPDDPIANMAPATGTHPRTRIYFTANVGLEIPTNAPSTQTSPSPRPPVDATGRIWALETTGVVAKSANGSIWAYPEANDPNDAKKDRTVEPSLPIGAFLHATPAMGIVQFPATITNGDGTAYVHTDAVHTTNVIGQSVPMLYVGTRGTSDTSFYALDVDGSSDTSREIYGLPSPTLATFESSPVLVVNASNPPAPTLPGNGGAVFATAGNSLIQFTATPITNLNSGQAFPFVGADRIFGGFGPISSPAVAAADTSDLVPTGYPGGRNATDWVYVGDGSTGFCRGITPQDPNDIAIVSPVAFGGPFEEHPPRFPDQRYALRTFIFDGTNAHLGNDTNMNDANPLNGTLPVFEWGKYVYVRIGNVVPPGFDPASPNPSLLVQDPNDSTGTTFYGNGQQVTFRMGDVSNPAANAPLLTVPNTVLTSLNSTAPAPPPNGFIQRSDTGTPDEQAQGGVGSLRQTADAAGKGWIAAYSYPIGSSQNRAGDTPGAQRQVVGAIQTATRYKYTPPTGGVGVGTYTADGVLSLAVQQGSVQVARTDAAGNQTGIVQLPPVEQPTIGILNPLALRGGGRTLPVPTATSVTTAPVGDANGIGPFRPIDTTLPNGSLDLEALANGNYVPTKAPPNGIPVNQDYTKPSTHNTLASYPQKYRFIATSLGQIRDNSSGDNSDPTTTGTPVGKYSNGGNGLSNNTDYGPYTMDAADRSDLGQADKTIFPAIALGMRQIGAHWNDNTPTISNGSANLLAGGPGACVNRLPWEDVPSSQSLNTSRDYPDIPAAQIGHFLINTLTSQKSDMTARPSQPSGAIPDQASGSGSTRTINLNPIQITMSVPPHQPANLQVWDNTLYTANGSGAITPQSIAPGDPTFPEGYVEGGGVPQLGGAGQSQRVYVDLFGNGTQSPGAPYREVAVFSGVSVNMSTSIAEGTTDIGNAPSDLGIQTGSYAGLKDALNNVGFTPYNQRFLSFFKPVTVLNNGNVNLLNIHFNQKIQGATGILPRPIVSDPLDPLNYIPGYDVNGITGNASPFVIRSSIDTDLLANSRNPGIATSGLTDPYAQVSLSALFPSATFHKPRVGDSGPSTLTVPDVPENNTSGTAFSLTASAIPALGNTAPPYLSTAIPFGTPVGSYSTPDDPYSHAVQLFEGMDMSGYPNGGSYSSVYPPQYGGAVGGQQAPNVSNMTDVYVKDVNGQGGSPASLPGTKLKVTVIEDRMTDGLPFGALPQIDAGPAIPASGSGATAVPAKSSPDLAPAAFRDPATGALSVYWTSGRSGSNYGIYGAHVNYTYPAFLAASGGQSWWSPVDVSALPTPGTNSGMTVAQDQPVYNGTQFSATDTTAYAFAANVTTGPYQNRIYCYPITQSSGALGTGQLVSNDVSQVKYGAHGLYVKTANVFTNNLWAFWTASTRGRTTIYYNSRTAGTGDWANTPALMPIPAGLTSVADPTPVLMTAPVIAGGGGFAGGTQSVIEVTYSGVAPDGATNLYSSRYTPAGTSGSAASQLVLASYPTVTERLTLEAGWYQARDVAWSRIGALNLSVGGVNVLYNSTTPLFSKATFDKASGLLVLTGIPPTATNSGGSAVTTFNLISPSTSVTAYLDLATGRIRFMGGTPTGLVMATFNPLARRITEDTRANTGPVTFLDPTFKDNASTGGSRVQTDRRWYIWRKAGVSGDTTSASLYYKTQRLTMFLPSPIGYSIPAPSATPNLLLTSVTIGTTDITNYVDVDSVHGRIYFPISAGGMLTEGKTATVTYAPASTVNTGNPNGTTTSVTDTVQWQDEERSNDPFVPLNAATGLATVVDTALPIDRSVNENNVSAFLDTDAYKDVSGGSAATDAPHKVWLFWNSTRNGTSDLYYETIDPKF